MTNISFAHIGLTCNDPITLEKFYTQHFGFKRIRVIPLGETQIVFTRSGGLVLEIFRAEEERPIPQARKDGPSYAGWRHISFNVPNVDAKLEEMGSDAKITLGPIDFDDFIPRWRTVWIADPEGNIIEITQGFMEEENPPAL